MFYMHCLVPIKNAATSRSRRVSELVRLCEGSLLISLLCCCLAACGENQSIDYDCPSDDPADYKVDGSITCRSWNAGQSSPRGTQIYLLEIAFVPQ